MRISPTVLDRSFQTSWWLAKTFNCNLRRWMKSGREQRGKRKVRTNVQLVIFCWMDYLAGRKGQTRRGPLELVKSDSRPNSPELLHSDDEETSAITPTTLSNLPQYFPGLPPKHTYLQTPVRCFSFIGTWLSWLNIHQASPPKKAALPSLEKKLKTAALVQESLQNLLTATEDAMNQEDSELLGHIVNWELSVQPRKRWCVSKVTSNNMRF